jgi:L-rhamnose-H+ transport protein
MNALIGVLLVLAGGFASGSFYLPYTRVKKWTWETYWLFGGLFSWLIVPFLAAYITVPNLFSLYAQVNPLDLFLPVLFGLLWGVGGLTFGLALRYLGMSLGMAMALGLTAAFGTLIPPIFKGELVVLLSQSSGIVTLLGVLACLLGIGITGRAGMSKDRELNAEKKQESVTEFDFKKGIPVAVIAGLMSACFAFGIAAGKPLAQSAVESGAKIIHQNNPTFVLILIGGLITNALWCVRLALKNKSYAEYVNRKTPLLKNYLLSAVAGTIWYTQFFFYGMGESQMGQFAFAAWSILMASAIIFSNMWGLINKEWKGASRKTLTILFSGIFILILSTFIIGLGSYIQK